ncbi:MAG: phage holin family protein [Christensenellaceae bacterium]|jgi:hypothetical protein
MEMFDQYAVATVTAVCVGVGFVLKHALDFLPNKYIPLILAVFGIALNCWVNGFQMDIDILLGGLASGLMAVGVFEFGKQMFKKGGGGDENGH